MHSLIRFGYLLSMYAALVDQNLSAKWDGTSSPLKNAYVNFRIFQSSQGFFIFIFILLFTFYGLEFKGVPDPLRGDEIYKRVRDMAKVVNV